MPGRIPRQGGYGGDFGRGEYGEAGSHSVFSDYREPDRDSDDEKLRERILERLRGDPAIDARDVVIKVRNARVTFEGAVDSHRTKFLVEDAADQLGVDDIQNNLNVRRS
jgi:osmotically-inducible protein OsmY